MGACAIQDQCRQRSSPIAGVNKQPLFMSQKPATAVHTCCAANLSSVKQGCPINIIIIIISARRIHLLKARDYRIHRDCLTTRYTTKPQKKSSLLCMVRMTYQTSFSAAQVLPAHHADIIKTLERIRFPAGHPICPSRKRLHPPLHHFFSSTSH